MFIGSINRYMRAVLEQAAAGWKNRPIYVACSGNFTVERILACGEAFAVLFTNPAIQHPAKFDPKLIKANQVTSALPKSISDTGAIECPKRRSLTPHPARATWEIFAHRPPVRRPP